MYNAAGLDVPALAMRLRETGSLVGAPGTSRSTTRAVRARRRRPRPGRARGPDHGRERRPRAGAGSSPRGRTARSTRRPTRSSTSWASPVIPDILCNAGGVIVSYFEWAQNRSALAWTVDEVNERLRRQILAAADAVWQRGRRGADPVAARRPSHRGRARRGSDPRPRPLPVIPVSRSRPMSAFITPRHDTARRARSGSPDGRSTARTSRSAAPAAPMAGRAPAPTRPSSARTASTAWACRSRARGRCPHGEPGRTPEPAMALRVTSSRVGARS